MTDDPESIPQKLLLEEVVRIVSDTKEGGLILRTGSHAARLFTTYHGAKFSLGRIIDELTLEATREGRAGANQSA